MPDYQKLYTLMFNAATDVLEDLNAMNFGAARDRLRFAQQRAEELYISRDDSPDSADDAP